MSGLDKWFDYEAARHGYNVKGAFGSFMERGFFHIPCIGRFAKDKDDKRLHTSRREGEHTTWIIVPVENFYRFMENLRRNHADHPSTDRG